MYVGNLVLVFTKTNQTISGSVLQTLAACSNIARCLLSFAVLEAVSCRVAVSKHKLLCTEQRLLHVLYSTVAQLRVASWRHLKFVDEKVQNANVRTSYVILGIPFLTAPLPATSEYMHKSFSALISCQLRYQ